jgi:hypothetical protein
MRSALSGLLLLAQAEGGGAEVRRLAEAMAGRPVRVDPRLAVPACKGGLEVTWRDDSRRALRVRCLAPGWHYVLPVGGEGTASRTPLIRRGQPVQVLTGGAGFRVVIEGVAEGEGHIGQRVVVRNLRSGQRLLADVGADGALRLAGATGT